jgi:uncharacterized protein YuzE
MKIRDYSYSPYGDVIYFKLGKNKSKYGEMDEGDVILYYDESGKIVGIEILDFQELYENGFLKNFLSKKIPKLKWKEVQEIYKKVIMEIPKSVSI